VVHVALTPHMLSKNAARCIGFCPKWLYLCAAHFSTMLHASSLTADAQPSCVGKKSGDKPAAPEDTDMLQQSRYTVPEVTQLLANKHTLKASLKVKSVQQMVQLCKKQPGKCLSKQSQQQLSGPCQQRWCHRLLSVCTADKVKLYGHILLGQSLLCLSLDRAAGLAW